MARENEQLQERQDWQLGFNSQVSQKSHAGIIFGRYLLKNSPKATASRNEMELKPKNPHFREWAVGIQLCSPRPDSVYKGKKKSSIQRQSYFHHTINIFCKMISVHKNINWAKWLRQSINSYPLFPAFDCVDHNKLWEILQEMGIPDDLTCLLRNPYEVKKQ